MTVSKNPTIISPPGNQNLNETTKTSTTTYSENSYKPLSENKGHWIFEDSDTRYLTDNEVKNLSADDLWKARNEIYAKNGYIFNTDRGRQYTESLGSFYSGIEPDVKKVYQKLNNYEKYNIKIIQKYETK